ncbi:MAG: recombinase family protein [Chloracidobacterium sp.]|nr:recombinase family protein [Chloracidobacterium sp.]
MNEKDVVRSRGGVAPFGYRWHEGKLEIDESEAPVRRLIYDLFLKHRRKKTVAKLLNDLGYRTRNKAKFSDTAIDRLLRDKTAKGTRDEGGLQIEVEPIVSTDIWDRANRLLGVRENKPSANVFVGRLACACGGSMSVPSNSNKYVCGRCRSKIPADDLENVFTSQIGRMNFGAQVFEDRWPSLSNEKKRLVVEHLCEKIVVARESISIRFACDPSLFKAPTLEQRSEPGNETPHEPNIDSGDSSDIVEPLLSEAEASRFLGISKMTLLRKRNAGLIGFFRVGIRVLYSKEKHLLPYLAKCEVQGQRLGSQR